MAAVFALAATACSEDDGRRFGSPGLAGDDDLIREIDQGVDLREGVLHVPFAGDVQILYAHVDGQAIWAGDILLDEAALQGFRAATTINLWPDGRVEYAFRESLPAATRTGVLQAMEIWKARTGVRFVEVEPRGGGYVSIGREGPGCYAHSGYWGDGFEHKLNLGEGCDSPRVYAHELGHVLGLFHEQSRSDRDEHVLIDWDNIQPGLAHAFDKYEKKREGQDRGSYDYVSVMHYGSDAFAVDPAKPTIVRKDGGLIDWATDLSAGDAAAVKAMYATQPEQQGGAAEDPNGEGCAGHCGSLQPTAAGCHCDARCVDYGDCCPDQQMVCEPPKVPVESCAGLCDAPEAEHPGANGGECYCDDACVEHDDCCSDRVELCGSGDGGGGNDGVGTCVGHCGGAGSEGTSCHCDAECTGHGDCCADYEAVCGGSGTGDTGSCVGHCNSPDPVEDCFCEPTCVHYGDCCTDYLPVCQ